MAKQKAWQLLVAEHCSGNAHDTLSPIVAYEVTLLSSHLALEISATVSPERWSDPAFRVLLVERLRQGFVTELPPPTPTLLERVNTYRKPA